MLEDIKGLDLVVHVQVEGDPFGQQAKRWLLAGVNFSGGSSENDFNCNLAQSDWIHKRQDATLFCDGC